MQSIKNDCYEMTQRPYIALVSRDFCKRLCLWSHGIVFQSVAFCPQMTEV